MVNYVTNLIEMNYEHQLIIDNQKIESVPTISSVFNGLGIILVEIKRLKTLEEEGVELGFGDASQSLGVAEIADFRDDVIIILEKTNYFYVSKELNVNEPYERTW